MATHFLIEGRVQGVGYRMWCREEAARRGLTGFVRNLSDGRVEALVAGPTAMVDDFLAACRKGPPGANVTAIGLEPTQDDPDTDTFLILPTR